MYEFLSLTEPAPLEPFNIASILKSVDSNSDLFRGVFGDFDAREELELSNPHESDRMMNLLSLTNIDPRNPVLPNGSQSIMARASLSEHNCRTSFLSLPAEIRVVIYELVLEDEIRIPPPITQVSHRIREESLEYWYGAARFPILFRIGGWYDGSIGKGTPSYEMVSPLHESAYPMLRKLLLTVGGNAEYCFSVNFDKQSNSCSIKHRPRNVNARFVSPVTRRTDRLMKKFDEALTEMVNWSGVGNMTFSDCQRLIPQPSWKFWSDIPDEDYGF